MLVNHLLEGVATGSRTSSVETDADVTVLRQHLIESKIHRATVGIHHLLGTWTTVTIHHHGIALVWVEARRFHHPTVQSHTIFSGEADDFAFDKTVVVHRVLHVLVVVQHT